MKKRVLSLLLALVMAFSLMPTLAFAADTHDGEVRVIISNDTYPEAEGAPWEGTLVDEWVKIDDASTVMSCVVAALDNNGYEQSGAEGNYISTINGLSASDGGGMSGWMGTLNDWFTNYGFGNFTVAAGNFGAGDEIHIMYTCAYGDDLGGSWGNNNTWINGIVFSAGTLDKDFDPEYTAESGNYTLTLPAGTTEVNVQPTAANKNYMVRIFLNDFEEDAETHYGTYEYKRNDLIPVKNGDTIYVGCGFPDWPSMNESEGGCKYAFKVVIPEAEQKADYKTVLNNTLAQLAVTVSNPAFGTGGGEWSVLSLARGGYFAVGDPYFETYYSNVEKTVPGLEEKALASGKAAGALDKNKSTENSRLIIALSAIDKDPTNVGGVNVLGAYDANEFTWIKKQGINGPIFALIALDTRNYPTTDTTLRQQCVDFILGKELTGGGWALSGTTPDPDITSMALQALVNYKEQANVSAAASRAFTALSQIQKDNGGFASWGSVNSESIAQVITACSAWGIDADKDSRFVKSGGSALDALLTFYIPEGKGFAHVLTSGGGYTGGEVNGMATDQAAYALVAYDRFKSDKTALYDMSDVHHTFGSWTDTTPASCTEDGVKAHYHCSVCEKNFDENEAELNDLTITKLGHNFDDAWQKDATGHWHVCQRANCDAKDTVVAHTFNTNNCAQEATCTDCGYVKLAGQHTWGTVSYDWQKSDETYTCTASVKCVSCQHTETGTGAVTSAVTTDPTCETKGVCTYTAAFENSLFPKATYPVDINAKGHSYGDAVFTWAADGKSATAERVCANNGSHKLTGAAVVTSAKKTDPTCEVMGWTTYTATITLGDDTYTETKAVQDIPALGHNYGDAVFTWADDGKSATAERVCANNGSHKLTGAAVVTSAVKTQPTCEVKGTTTYTAKITLGEVEYTDTKDVQDITALGHNYDKAEFTWAEDGKSATAKRVCKNNASHVLTGNAAITSAVKNDPTCTEKGTTTYTATITLGDQEYTADKDVQDIAALGHDFTKQDTDSKYLKSEASCTSAAVYYYSCSRCAQKSTADTFVYGSTTAHNYGPDGKCICGAVNPMKYVKTGNIAAANKVGGKTVAVEEGKQIVADDSGLAVKTNSSVDLNDVKEAVAAGSTVVKIDENVNKTITATEADKTGIEALKELASDTNITGEQKYELDEIVVKLESYNDNAAKPNVKVEQVVDVSLELVKASDTNVTLGEIKNVAQPVEIRIPVTSNSLKNAFANPNKVVKAIISHTEVNGDVTTIEADVTFEDGKAIILMDAFSTVAFVTYDKAPDTNGGSSSYKPADTRTFTTDLAVGSINAVFVDGKKLDSKYYTISGSTVTLTEAFMATLKAGKHTIRIENATRMATAAFNVAANGVLSARTGDAGVVLYIAMCAMSCIGSTALLCKRKEEA